LGTLDTLTITMALLFFFITITFSAALGMRVPLIFVKFDKFASLWGVHFVISVLLFVASENHIKSVDLLDIQWVWERDLEDKVQVTELVSLFVERQTFANNGL
jgi:hypothetical protein